jgi:thiol-disulfide isomerase/thioredoxin
MTLDLERQLNEYAEILDSTLPVLEAGTVIEAGGIYPVVESRGRGWSVLAKRPWLAAAAALLVVLVLIGGTSLIFSGDGGVSPADDPVEEPVVTPTTQASVTTVAGDEAAVIPGVDGSVYVSARWMNTGFATQEEIGGPIERVEQVWYLDAEMWRIEKPVWRQGDSTELEGDVTIFANNQLFEYRAMSNTFEIVEQDPAEPDLHPAVDIEFVYDCDQGGCTRTLNGDRWEDCTITENVVVLGSATVEYDCTRPPEWNDNETETVTLNIDETGRTLKGVLTHTTETGDLSILEYEILELDLNPIFPASLFEFECPTEDCRDIAIPLDPVEHPLVGQPVPEVSGELRNGGPFDIADHRGERIILLLWASWCPPCTDELATLEAFSATASDVTIVTGAVFDQPTDVAAVIDDMSIALPVIDLYTRNLTQGSYLAEQWSGSGIPILAFIDENGTIVAVHPEARGIEGLTNTLQQLGW